MKRQKPTDLAGKQSTTTGNYEHVIWISFWGNMGLAALKISMGILGYSRLLFADGLHSSANAIISITFLIGVIAGERPKDSEHPYGHHKAQYIFSCSVCLIILAAACYLFMLGIRGIRLISMSQFYIPNIIVVVVVFVSIIGNELLFRYTISASHKYDSVSLRSNAWDNRINIFSSMVVLMSLIGSMVGFWQLEQIGTIIIAIIIIWTCMRIFQRAFEGFMSKSLPAELTEKIKNIVKPVKGVRTISAVKTQLAGEKIYVDIVVGMDGTITIADASTITNRIKEKLFQNLKKIEDVRVELRSV